MGSDAERLAELREIFSEPATMMAIPEGPRLRVSEMLFDSESTLRLRALRLRDQVLKTWSPPLIAGGESKADVAQTAVMQTLAFVMGRPFLEEQALTDSQASAIESGVRLMERTLLDAKSD